MLSATTAEMEPFNIKAEMVALLDDMSNEDLYSIAASQQDPTSDDQMELYIYICFLIFKVSSSKEHLERAVQQAQVWVANTAAGHPDRTRKIHVLNMMSAWVFALEDIAYTSLESE